MDFKLEGVSWNLEAVKKFKSEASFIDRFSKKYLSFGEDKQRELLAKVYSQVHPKKEAKPKKKSATKKD